MMNTLTGTGQLVRLILRRDRVLMPLWVLFFALLPIGYVASFADLFPTAADREQYARSAANAGFITLYGPLSGSSLGELATWRAGFLPVLIGLISLLTVIRHTRTEEETGRRELLGGTAIGRHAGLAAALLTTCAANVVLAVLLALGMMSQDLPVAGSFAIGAQFAAAGWVFAGVGGLAAQLTSGAGSARGIAVGVLGATYLLRVVGDLSPKSGGLSWVSWLSPIGWTHRIQPYGGERWWILLLAAGCTGVLAATAGNLSAHRDIGAGLWADRAGPAEASPGLRSPLALAWRLHRGLLVAWTAGLGAVGVVLGVVAESVGDLLGESQQTQELFERIGGQAGPVDVFLSTSAGLYGLIAAAYAVQATLKQRVEETSERAETVLATAVSRLGWAASHLFFAVVGPAAALTVAGLATGFVHGLNTGDVGAETGRMFGAVLVQLPAVWVLTAVTVALFGLLPRLAVAGWGALLLCVLIGLVGSALQLGTWVLDISPFTHLPRLPGAPVELTPLVVLAAVAAALTAAGLAGLRHRDIPIG